MVAAGRPAAVECSVLQPWGLSLRDFRKTSPGVLEGREKVQTQRFLLPAWKKQLYIHLLHLGNFYLVAIPTLLIILGSVQGQRLESQRWPL